ncbi:MAG TPA: YciI family protein [Gemmatimonadaceae bacterium]|nr:YciI family protein [Gemmatimonadaceae bacterium]
MRYLSIWKAAETNVPPSPDEIMKMGELIEDMTKKGELIATEGCLPSALGARVRKSGNKVTITDGPFTESKELIAGFALLEAESKEAAIEMCKRFMDVAGDGECEIRQIYTAPPDGAVSVHGTESSARTA